jgi:hypothetical protein
VWECGFRPLPFRNVVPSSMGEKFCSCSDQHFSGFFLAASTKSLRVLLQKTFFCFAVDHPPPDPLLTLLLQIPSFSTLYTSVTSYNSNGDPHTHSLSQSRKNKIDTENLLTTHTHTPHLHMEAFIDSRGLMKRGAFNLKRFSICVLW